MTAGKIPDLDYAVRDHNQKLNNYLKYGMSVVNAKLPDPLPVITVDRDVHHMNSVSFMEDNGQTYKLVTILCCEDKPISAG